MGGAAADPDFTSEFRFGMEGISHGIKPVYDLFRHCTHVCTALGRAEGEVAATVCAVVVGGGE